jgi:ketol-acid reductoisomerase
MKLTKNGEMIKSIANVIKQNCAIEIRGIWDNTSKATKRKHIKYVFSTRFVKTLQNDNDLREKTLTKIKNEIAANCISAANFQICFSQRLNNGKYAAMSNERDMLFAGVIVKFDNLNI